MKSVNVIRIKKTNPSARAYFRKVNLLNKEMDKSDNKPFYAIYLGDVYRAASVVSLDKEKSRALIKMQNFSAYDREFIEQEAIKKIKSIINDNYGIEEVEVKTLKKI